MFGSSLSIWLKEEGVSRTDIGFAGLIYVVFSINFLWAPLVDRFRPNFISYIGHRKTWVLFAQLAMVSACACIFIFSTGLGIKTLVLFALIISSASATQDIAIDAFRVDQFQAHETALISAAAAAATAGWYTGFAGIGFVPLWLSDQGWSWPNIFLSFGLVTGLVTLIACLLPIQTRKDETFDINEEKAFELKNIRLQFRGFIFFLCIAPLALVIWSVASAPGLPRFIYQDDLFVLGILGLECILFTAIVYFLNQCYKSSHQLPAPRPLPLFDGLIEFLINNLIMPLREFITRNGLKFGLTLLLFVFFFKLGEAFLGRMSIIFYKEIGFTNTQIANNSKLLNWFITVVSAIPCAWANAKLGIVRGLFISGIFMAASNLMFAWIALAGPQLDLYMAAIVVDGITTTWASVAFVSFISILCNHRFSATQYALLASLGSLGRMVVASFSGQVVDSLDGNWVAFFIFTALMVIPGLALLLHLRANFQTKYLTNKPH